MARKRSENLIGPRATVLRLVNQQQREADARAELSLDDGEWKPWMRRRKQTSHVVDDDE